MFDALRRMIIPIIVIVLVFFIAMIVLEWGLNLTGRGPGGYDASLAGTINGQPIPIEVWQQTYSDLYQQAVDQSPEGEVSEVQEEQIEDQAWNQIMSMQLMQQQADKHNIAVTDDDIYLYLRYSPPQYLQTLPTFQTNGSFDYQKYVGAMTDPQWAGFWARLEPQLRQELRAAKVQQIIIESAAVSEEEVKQAFIAGTERVKVRAINVHSQRFMAQQAQITQEELRDYWQNHKDEFPLEQRAVVKLAAVSTEPSEEDWAIAEDRANELLDSIKAGADFAELATAYSDDAASAQDGGDLGWFRSGRMVAEFDSVAFSLREGMISDPPFRTQFGYHIVKHQGYRGEAPAREANVSHILVGAEASQGTLTQANDSISRFYDIAVTKGMDSAAAATGIEVQEPKPLVEGRTVEGIGWAPEVIDFALNAEPGALSNIINTGDYLVLVRVEEVRPAGPAVAFEEVEQQVSRTVAEQFLLDVTEDSAKVILADIRNGMSFEEAAEAHGETVDTTTAFTRNGFVTGFGSSPRFIGTAFSLTEEGQMSDVVRHSTGSAILELVERTSPDLSAFTEKRDSVYNSLMQNKQQQLFTRWFEQLVENSEIENNIEKMRQASVN